MVDTGTFAGAIMSLVGEPQSFAASIIIYTIVGILFLRIFEGIMSFIALLWKSVWR
jgi:uncharacterized membrane protein YccC